MIEFGATSASTSVWDRECILDFVDDDSWFTSRSGA